PNASPETTNATLLELSRARRPLVVGVVRVGVAEPPPRRVLRVGVVPAPPLIRWTLRIALRRILPILLAAKRGHIEEVPGVHKHLVAPAVDEVGAEHAVAVPDERVGAVPVLDAEILVEVVGHAVPRVAPAHFRLHPLEFWLRCTRGIDERGVARVEVGE